MGSISPKTTKKTENDTVGRHRFRWNLDSKFYLPKQILCAMGKSEHGFGLEIIRKSKLKKMKKNWIWWFLSLCTVIVTSFLTLLSWSVLLFPFSLLLWLSLLFYYCPLVSYWAAILRVDYFLTFQSQIWSTYFFIQMTSWQIENNTKAMCQGPTLFTS